MKRSACLFSLALLCFTAPARAQDARTEDAALVAQLQSIRVANKALIEQQQKTLQALEELKAAAEQIKVLGKRG